MTKQQNIRYLSIVGLLTALIMIGFLCMSAVQHRVTSRLDTMAVNFDRPTEHDGFLNKAHVVRLIKNSFGDDLSDRVVDETDLSLIEEILNKDTYISEANAYLNGANKLIIDIEERIPKYRVMHDGNADYYVDGQKTVLPLHKRYVMRVPVITVDRNHAALSVKMHEQLLDLVNQITADDFLNALIEQVHIDNHDVVYVMPKVGKEKLQFGELADISEKLYKIKRFYKKGLPTVGWNTYDKIDLSFKDQIIGTIKEK